MIFINTGTKWNIVNKQSKQKIILTSPPPKKFPSLPKLLSPYYTKIKNKKMSILHPKASSFFFQNPYKINTIFLRVFKAYFSFTKTFYVGYPCGSELKTLFLAVLRLYFDGLLCKIKITSSKNKFYILNKTILCIFKKKKKK